jgi:hypothetical protein
MAHLIIDNPRPNNNVHVLGLKEVKAARNKDEVYLMLDGQAVASISVDNHTGVKAIVIYPDAITGVGFKYRNFLP